MTAIIDAHQHYWQRSKPFDYGWLDNPQLSKISGDYLPQDLAPLIQQVGVQNTIFVQTQHNLAENRWVLSLCDSHPFIIGMVGWVDLSSPECEDQLAEFIEHPKFVGLRHVTHDEPDDDFIVRPEVIRGLKVLEKHRVPFDLLFYVKHLKHAITLAKELPDLPMVIDHLAKPRIKDQAFDDWLPTFRQAAKFPNLFCKLSGMVTEADWDHWQPSDVRPYVQHALELFGPDRCMYGSDWPVCELAASYEQVFHALTEAIGGLSETEQAQILGETATRCYGL